MEESEKRKERLRAMCAGAVQPEPVDGHFSSTAPMHRLNPLVQPSATPPDAERSPPPSRFDYYTDPMSAYSGYQRRSRLDHHLPDGFSSPIRGSSPMAHLPSPSSGQGGHYMTPTLVPANHFQVGHSPQPGPYVTPSPVPQYGLWRSPVGMSGMSGHFSWRSSVGMSGSTSATGLPLSSSRGILASPGFGRGVSPSADPGRGSPSVNSGRGSSWRPGNYQSPRSGGGSYQGGRVSKEPLSAREFPGMFFRKPMVLDPWEKLEPVVGFILEPKTKQITPDFLKSWLPESTRTKRVKLGETSSVSHSQGSLAEYIALAFEEAVNDETA